MGALLIARDDVMQLSAPDSEHIAGDIGRTYAILIVEWLAYMRHLRNEYLSLACSSDESF